MSSKSSLSFVFSFKLCNSSGSKQQEKFLVLPNLEFLSFSLHLNSTILSFLFVNEKSYFCFLFELVFKRFDFKLLSLNSNSND